MGVKQIQTDMRIMKSMQKEIIMLRKLVRDWRKALGEFANDEHAFMDCFHDVLDQTDRLTKEGKLK